MLSVANEDVISNSMVPDCALSLSNSTNHNVCQSKIIEEEMVEQYFQQTQPHG